MDHNTTRTRRPQSPACPPHTPAALFRSKSRSSPATSTPPENYTHAIGRSKSVTRSRSKKDEENVNPSGFAKLLQRGSNVIGKGGVKSSPASSPSAWALSPGRSLKFPLAPSEGVRGKVGGVLRYFRRKKGCGVMEEEEFHRFRMLQNGLLQWRFANAAAETSMAKLKRLTQDKIFSVWLHNLRMRNRIVERRVQIEILKHEIKLYTIIFPQIALLNQWARLDKRNQESVGNLGSLLSTISHKIPLLHGAKVDMGAIEEAMSMAMEVIAKLEAVITKYTSHQVEKVLYVLTERLSMFKEQEECLDDLHKAICLVTTLLVKENNLIVQLMQANKVSRRLNPIIT